MALMWIGSFSQNYATIGQKTTWVSYFQLDHAVSFMLDLFMELSKLESRAQMGNSNKVLKALHQISHDSPARRNDYVDVTGSSRFCLPFGQVAVRAIQICDGICQLCTFWQSLPKSKRPSSQKLFNAAICNQRSSYLGKTTFLFLYSWYHETISYRIPVY